MSQIPDPQIVCALCDAPLLDQEQYDGHMLFLHCMQGECIMNCSGCNAIDSIVFRCVETVINQTPLSKDDRLIHSETFEFKVLECSETYLVCEECNKEFDVEWLDDGIVVGLERD